MQAQKLHGTYRLYGVQDMASAFLFTEEGKFEFFNIYGAADRHASGTYTLEGNKLTLHSHKTAGADFPIALAEKRGSGYTIQIKEDNPFLRQYVTALYFRGDKEEMAASDEMGTITIPDPNVDRIYLRHEIYPDIACLIKDQNNHHNYFEVTLSPSLAEVSFQGIDFTVQDNTLTCLPNYFLPFQNIRFVKE